MPSFTSSSDLVKNSSHGRAPGGHWLGALIIFIIGFIALFGGLELFWRAQGHAPSINDSQSLWAQQRALINKNAGNPKTTVLVGASRIQLGFDTQVFRETYPDRPLVNLAIDGSPSAAVLRDLALDDDFKGLVIASVKADWFSRDKWGLSQGYVTRYHKDYKNSLDRQFNTAVTLWLQEHFVVFQHNLGVRSLLKALINHELPDPFYLRTYPDRSRAADYSKMHNVNAHKEERVRRMRVIDQNEKPQSFDSWREDLKAVAGWVEAIQSRGGQVIFIRFPTSGEHWEIDERRYPRNEFWDQLSRLTAAPTLHFQDIDGMSDFELPDTSHLDAKDRAEFTRIVQSAVERAGLLSPD